MLPYGHQIVDEADIAAVAEVLRSDWLTTGPKVAEFEAAVAAFTGAKHGVAVINGTAALHTAMAALGIGKGDEVIVPPITFVASANAVLYQGGTPVFADVEAGTLLLDVEKAANAISPRTKAIVAVDYTGQPADWQALRKLADAKGLFLLADACHSLGAGIEEGQIERKCGTFADISALSFHPVKHITTGEGGMCLTDNAALAEAMRRFRNHGIGQTAKEREEAGAYHYEMQSLGFNYRLPDINCTLGISQLKKLPAWLQKRRELAALYTEKLKGSAAKPLARRAGTSHAWHLFMVRVPAQKRDIVYAAMRKAGIGVNVHYEPVHLHPYYRQHAGTKEGLCPVAEAAAKELLTLPLWPGMEEKDVDFVTQNLIKALG